jgi:rhomboid protease GluP
VSKCAHCGRELLADGGPNAICPECRTALIARSQAQAATSSRAWMLVRAAPVTTTIIAVNVAVFVAMTLSGASLTSPSNEFLVRWGALTGTYTIFMERWRVLTSNYVHIGLLHIAFNMWCLWNLGFLAERIFDRWTYFLAYTVCGIAGSLASLAVHPHQIGAGASGAIFGLAGALISALYLGHLPVHPSALKATLKSLLSFAGYNLVFGAVVPGIDNWAHIGGLVAGLALGTALSPHLTSSPKERKVWRLVIFVTAAAILWASLYGVQHLTVYRALHRVPPA